MRYKICHILQDEVLGFVPQEDLDNKFDEISVLRAVQTKLLTRFGEGLAGEASAQDVVRWYIIDPDGANITLRHEPKVAAIEVTQTLIDVAGEYALMPETPQADVKPTQPTE